MSSVILVDTGPLVALIDRGDRRHVWSTEAVGQLKPPFLTCEAVLSESWFLLRRVPNGQAAILNLVRQDLVRVAFDFQLERDRLLELIQRYDSVPMSIADACLVRLSERFPNSRLLTLDSDFLVYRRFDREPIPVIFPSRE